MKRSVWVLSLSASLSFGWLALAQQTTTSGQTGASTTSGSPQVISCAARLAQARSGSAATSKTGTGTTSGGSSAGSGTSTGTAGTTGTSATTGTTGKGTTNSGTSSASTSTGTGTSTGAAGSGTTNTAGSTATGSGTSSNGGTSTGAAGSGNSSSSSTGTGGTGTAGSDTTASSGTGTSTGTAGSGTTGTTTTPSTGAGNTGTSAGSSTSTSGKKTLNDLSTDEVCFMDKAAASNQFEIQSSQVALKKSSNTAVKKLAQMIIKDHQTAGSKLKALAAQYGAQPSSKLTAAQQQEVKTLGGLSGNAFDLTYLSQQISAHNDAVALFKSYSQEAAAPTAAVRQFASQILPSLENHLKEAQSAQKSLTTSGTGSSTKTASSTSGK